MKGPCVIFTCSHEDLRYSDFLASGAFARLNFREFGAGEKFSHMEVLGEHASCKLYLPVSHIVPSMRCTLE